jgi:hypothetical protein
MKLILQEFLIEIGIAQFSGLQNIMRVIRKDETDNCNIDMEEQNRDQDFGVVSCDICRKRNKNNSNEQDDINPEQT